VPLLDHVFVEFASRVPDAMKIEGGQGKSILKSAMRAHLDNETLYRAKQGFTPPLIEWLRGPLKEMAADLLLAPQAAYADYIEPSVVRQSWRAHQSGLRNMAPLLWAVMSFELWARKFLRAGQGEQVTHVAP